MVTCSHEGGRLDCEELGVQMLLISGSAAVASWSDLVVVVDHKMMW